MPTYEVPSPPTGFGSKRRNRSDDIAGDEPAGFFSEQDGYEVGRLGHLLISPHLSSDVEQTPKSWERSVVAIVAENVVNPRQKRLLSL
jgi:hypothetical protein